MCWYYCTVPRTTNSSEKALTGHCSQRFFVVVLFSDQWSQNVSRHGECIVIPMSSRKLIETPRTEATLFFYPNGVLIVNVCIWARTANTRTTKYREKKASWLRLCPFLLSTYNYTIMEIYESVNLSLCKCLSYQRSSEF